MGQLIDFTRYNENIRWTLANGWNIYIWNRMLQDQERTIQEEEKKFLSPETAFPFIPGASKGAPPLNPANIGMPIDSEYTTGQAGEIAERLHEKHPSEQVQFMSTPSGDNYFFQCLNQQEEPTFTWLKPKEVKQDLPDYDANITMTPIPNLVDVWFGMVKEMLGVPNEGE